MQFSVNRYTFFTFYLPLISNFILLMGIYMLCRFFYLTENWTLFASVTPTEMKSICQGGIRFDWSAICYTNALYLILQLLPIRYKETHSFQQAMKMLFLTTNGIAILLNMTDAALLEYIGRRSTSQYFMIIPNGKDTTTLWYSLYLLIPTGLLIWGMYKLYRMPTPLWVENEKKYVITGGILSLAGIIMLIGGIRGGLNPTTHPINQTDAFDYADEHLHATLVLNTPFSVCRTIGKKSYNTGHMTSSDKPYPFIRQAHKGPTDNRTNVIIILMGNTSQQDVTAQQMPSLHMLCQQGMTFRHAFANGNNRKDIRAAILTGIPTLDESLTSSHAAMNETSSIALELKKKSFTPYQISFREENIDGIMRNYGFKNNCPWEKINGLKEPFIAYTTIKGSSLQATDTRLKEFLKEAKKQSWYNHTLFVITGEPDEEDGATGSEVPLAQWQVPLLFYHPTDLSLKGKKEQTAQQTDILPTILGYLRYDRPYPAFGTSQLKSPTDQSFAVGCHDGHIFYIQGNLLLLTDGTASTGLYDFKHDPKLKENQLHKRFPLLQREMEKELNTLLHTYHTAMRENNLTVKRGRNQTAL